MKYIEENCIIDLAYVQAQMELKKREEILQNHKYSIWFSEKEQAWYTHLPDDTKSNGRTKVKRKKKKDLESVVVQFYEDLEKNVNEIVKLDFLKK